MTGQKPNILVSLNISIKAKGFAYGKGDCNVKPRAPSNKNIEKQKRFLLNKKLEQNYAINSAKGAERFLHTEYCHT